MSRIPEDTYTHRLRPRHAWRILWLALLVISAVIAVDLYYSRQAIEARERAQLAHNADVIASDLMRQLIEVSAGLELLRDNLQPLLAPAREPEVIEQRLGKLAASIGGVRALLVVDADGRSVASNRRDLVGLNFREQDRYRTMLEGSNPKALYASAPFTTPTGIFTISLGKVLLDARGQFNGYVLAILDPAYFNAVLRDGLYGPADLRVGLAHGDGKLIYRVPDPEKVAGRDFAANAGSPLLAFARSGEASRLEEATSTVTGARRVTAYQKIQPEALNMDRPLVAYVTRDAAAVLVPWWREVGWRLGALAALAVVSILALVLHQRRNLAFARDLAANEGQRREAEAQLAASRLQLEAANIDLADQVATRTAELVKSRNYFRRFVQQAPFAIAIVASDGRIVLRNDEFLRLIGYTQDDAPTVEDCWLRTFPDAEYRAQVHQRWEAAVRRSNEKSQPIAPVETRVTCADGAIREIETTGVHLDDEMLLTFVDVTERNRAVVALRTRSDEAEAANDAKSEFLANMSHEIRTPMNAILGAALLLENSRLDREQRGLVATIRTAGRAMLGLINTVLDLSKIESGRLELDESPFVLATVVGSIVDIFAPMARDKGIGLRCEPLPAVVHALQGDATRLGQILSNLIGNAIKFTARGEVTISATVEHVDAASVRLRFAVRDTGIGIDADKIAPLFSPFTQADRSIHREYGGTGLGLAICRRLVTAMGGEIGVDSEPGKGSEFWFVVPFLRAELPADAISPVVEGSLAQRLAGARILVVDDSQVNRDIAGKLLALEGASCETAANGREAVARLRAGSGDFDIVLMDVQMPEMDGLEATAVIRGELGLGDLPVIALTAGVLPSQQHSAKAAGMDDFVTKPFELDVLVATVLAHLPAGFREWAPVSGSRPVPPIGPGPASTFPTIPGIDGIDAGNRLQGNRELFYSVLRALRDEFADAVEQTRADVASGDHRAAAARMHKLAGIAGNASARETATTARALEARLLAGEADELAALLTRLEGSLRQVLSGLPADLDRQGYADAAGSAAGDATIAPDELAPFKAALAQSNARALKMYRALRPRLVARWGSTEFAPFAQAMDAMRFSDALEQLNRWYP